MVTLNHLYTSVHIKVKTGSPDWLLFSSYYVANKELKMPSPENAAMS